MFDWYHKNRRFDVSLVSSINLNILLLLLLCSASFQGVKRSIGTGKASSVPSKAGFYVPGFPVSYQQVYRVLVFVEIA